MRIPRHVTHHPLNANYVRELVVGLAKHAARFQIHVAGRAAHVAEHAVYAAAFTAHVGGHREDVTELAASVTGIARFVAGIPQGVQILGFLRSS